VRRLSWISMAQRTASTALGNFCKNCVARGIENAAASYRNEIVNGGSTGHHSPQRLFFVIGDQPAVVGDMGYQNGGDLAPHEDGVPNKSVAVLQIRTTGMVTARPPVSVK
jgi:hypothetical protein